jgi:hypothetical protein
MTLSQYRQSEHHERLNNAIERGLNSAIERGLNSAIERGH